MMNDNSVSSLMAMADAALEKVLREDMELADAKRHAREDVRKAIADGLLSMPAQGVPKQYVKRTNAYSVAEIKEKLAVIDGMVAGGMAEAAACRVSGISRGNLARWRAKIKAKGERRKYE
jgi:DNA invertase Pin-like site-specific DNA recombinase